MSKQSHLNQFSLLDINHRGSFNTKSYKYDGESIGNAFFFSTGIITDTGTCILHQNDVYHLFVHMK